MSFTDKQVAELSAKLDASAVKTRSQSGRSLSYVEAWHVIDEANRIFGFDGWTRETVSMIETNRDLVQLTGDRGPYQQWRVGYLAKVRVEAGGVVREGSGFGSGMSKPEALGEAIESAAKEAESDAMKRALMTFGNPFGLALYDKTQENVDREPPKPPKPVPPQSSPAENPAVADWKAKAEAWKAEIDGSISWTEIQDILDSAGFQSFVKFNAKGAAFLTERAKRKIANIQQGKM